MPVCVVLPATKWGIEVAVALWCRLRQWCLYALWYRFAFVLPVCVVLHRSVSLRRGGSYNVGHRSGGCVEVLVCVSGAGLRRGTGLRP